MEMDGLYLIIKEEEYISKKKCKFMVFPGKLKSFLQLACEYYV